jgi:hypothetical protein
VDPKTLKLLRQLGLLTDETVGLLSQLADLTLDGLDDLEAALLSSARQVADDPDTDATRDLDRLTALKASVDAVRTERKGRPDPAAQLAQLRDQLLADASPTVTHLAARRPARMRPRAAGTEQRPSITSAAGLPLDDAGALAKQLVSARRDLARAVPDGGRSRVATVSWEDQYPAERRLGTDPISNSAMVAAVASADSITASGGFCAPLNVRYDVPSFTSDERPLRDALPAFLANRGGLTYMRPPSVADLADGVTIWTSSNDQNPTNPTQKQYHQVVCATVEEVALEAVVKSARFGNFSALSHPEIIQANLTALGAAHARVCEQQLVTAMSSQSTAVTAGTILGATRDLLAALDRAGAELRNRFRTPPDFPLRVVAPDWLKDMLRTDLAREHPGATAERLAVADAEIETFLRVRNITPIWWLDASTTNFATQGVAALLGWPSTVTLVLYIEGSFQFLDGGSLDLGIVRDSVLNETNDAMVFAEVFESVAMLGPSGCSLAITVPLCPDGSTAEAVSTIGVCSTGS